jgi:hypothetical protein
MKAPSARNTIALKAGITTFWSCFQRKAANYVRAIYCQAKEVDANWMTDMEYRIISDSFMIKPSIHKETQVQGRSNCELEKALSL